MEKEKNTTKTVGEIRRSFEDIASKVLNDFLQPFIVPFQVLDKLRSFLERNKEQINETLKNFKENLECFSEYFKQYYYEYCVWLYDRGWPPLRDIPPRIIEHLRESCEGKTFEEQRKILNSFAISYYSSMIIKSDIFKNWKNRIQNDKRIKILEEAINAHFEGRYFLSVPIFFIQIEGIICEKFDHKKNFSKKDLEKYLLKANEEDSPDEINIFLNMLIENQYKNFYHGDEFSFDFNRHAIFHGEDLSYGNEVISLKSILILDFILNILYPDSFVITKKYSDQ